MIFKSLENERTHYFEHSIHALETQIKDILSVNEAFVRMLYHTVANTNHDIEKMQSFISQLTPRAFPALTALSEVLVEAPSLRGAIQEKKEQFEGSREPFKQAPKDRSQGKLWKERNWLDAGKIRSHIGAGDAKKHFDAALLQMSVEVMREQLAELDRTVRQLGAGVANLAKESERKLEGKMGAVMMQTMFDSIRRTKDRPVSKTTTQVSRQDVQQVVELPVVPARPVHSELYQKVYGNDPVGKQGRKPGSARPLTPSGHLASTKVREPSMM
jgi:hypothetical protein